MPLHGGLQPPGLHVLPATPGSASTAHICSGFAPSCPEGQAGAREEGGGSLEGAASIQPPPNTPARSSKIRGPGLRSGRETQTERWVRSWRPRGRPSSWGLGFPSGFPREGSSTGLVWVFPEAGLRLGCAPTRTPTLHRPEPPPLSGWAEGVAPGPQTGDLREAGRVPPSRRLQGALSDSSAVFLFFCSFFQISSDPRFFLNLRLRTFF